MCTLIMRRAHPREPTTVIRQTTHYIVRNDAFTDRLEPRVCYYGLPTIMPQ